MTEQEIISQLKKLKQISLSPEEHQRGLQLFLQKAEDKFSSARQAESVRQEARQPMFGSFGFSETLVQSREFVYRALRAYSTHIVASVMITVLVFGVFGAFSGMSARKALPDNKSLYTLKRALEKTQLTLSFSSSQRAAVRINHLDRRVEELNHIVAQTKANPEKDGVAVVNALRNTQSEIDAVKNDLVAVAENETPEDISEIKNLVEQQVSRFEIALSEVHEDLPEDIKLELEPEVAALNDSISQINEVIGQLSAKEKGNQAPVASPFDLGATTTDTVILIDSPASSTVTTTPEMLGEVEGVSDAEPSTPTNIKTSPPPAYVAPAPAVEEFSIEKDTFNVRIGD